MPARVPGPRALAEGDGSLVAGPQPLRRNELLAAAVFLLVAIAGLTWSKWWPYAHKLVTVLQTRTVGSSILEAPGKVAASPSFQAATSFATTYFGAIWKAMLAGLLIAAAIEAFLPRRWLLWVLSRGPRRLRGTFAGGSISMLSMMCTCCTSPVAVSLRRRRAPLPAALAFWLGNPTLNPAVLAFMAIVLPWQWVVVRIAAGVVLVFLIPLLVARLVPPAAGQPEPDVPTDRDDPVTARGAAGRFARALGRLSVTLIPEYLVIIGLLGAMQGLLFPFGHDFGGWVVLLVLVLAVAGTLMAIPTGGEIPIIQGLLIAGLGAGPAGALLVTLPAISLPSLLMVGRAFPRPVLYAVTGCVVGLGMASAAVLWALGA